jgi:hypothetical protein
LTKTETGAGGEHDEDSTGRGENTGERQAGVGGTSAVESRGGDGTRDDLLDEGTILAVDGVSGGERDESGVSMRVDTGEGGLRESVSKEGLELEETDEEATRESTGEGECVSSEAEVARTLRSGGEDGRGAEWEGDVGTCGESRKRGEGGAMKLDAGDVGGEGDGRRCCATMWSNTGEAGGEGERERAAEDCGDDGWRGGEGVNAGVVDGEDGGEGDDWGRGARTWAGVGKVGGGERESASFLRLATSSRSSTNFFAGSLEGGGPHGY